jgi:RNA ligase (TIGR02306 family)
MRELASIEIIVSITPIEKADAIETARVKNWDVVVKKGEYKVGDAVLFIEVDAWVPTELAPFLSKGKGGREYNGVPGERLRTIKLRGKVSQGLILPYPNTSAIGEGQTLSEYLNLQKWERADTGGGLSRGNFPPQIFKSDQERIQNLGEEFYGKYVGKDWQVTEKLEGSSMTVYIIDGEFGICSRNIDLLEDESSHFWRTVRRDNIEVEMRALGFNNIAIQGELIGPGIQGNIYKLDQHEFYVYDVQTFNDGHQYCTPRITRTIAEFLHLRTVPLLEESLIFNEGVTIDEVLLRADGISRVNPYVLREGLVFKENSTDRTSWKAISNDYLLNEK